MAKRIKQSRAYKALARTGETMGDMLHIIDVYDAGTKVVEVVGFPTSLYGIARSHEALSIGVNVTLLASNLFLEKRQRDRAKELTAYVKKEREAEQRFNYQILTSELPGVFGVSAGGAGAQEGAFQRTSAEYLARIEPSAGAPAEGVKVTEPKPITIKDLRRAAREISRQKKEQGAHA